MTGPKEKYSKELIVEKSRDFIDLKGVREISIRNLAKHIGCSTQPLFRHYENSEALMKDVYQSIENYYETFVEKVSEEIEIPFLGMGMGYINFAKDHPNLFYALFMDTYYEKENLLDFFKNEKSDQLVEEMSTQIGLTKEYCRLLLRNIWLLTHGIATMIYTKQVSYHDNEIKEILFQGFYGFITILKSKEKENV